MARLDYLTPGQLEQQKFSGWGRPEVLDPAHDGAVGIRLHDLELDRLRSSGAVRPIRRAELAGRNRTVSFDTASLIVLSSVLIGFASVVVSADQVHPGTGCTTDAIGLSVGT